MASLHTGRIWREGNGGLDRKPQFVSGLNAVRCIATNAWRAGEASGKFNKHIKTDYKGYSCSKEFTSKAIFKLKAVAELTRRIEKRQEGVTETEVKVTEADATQVTGAEGNGSEVFIEEKDA